MANVLFKRIEDSSLINNYPITDGSFIVTKDGYVYVDYGNERVPIILQKKPAGIIEMYGGSIAPTGYLICDGSAVSRTIYSDLFAAIGTNYGDGDGSTTFNLPNLKGKVPVGLDSNDTDFDTLGKAGGKKEHKLTIEEMPIHRHNIQGGNNTAGVANAFFYNGSNTYTGLGVTQYEGGSQPHPIVQPYVVTNYIISY